MVINHLLTRMILQVQGGLPEPIVIHANGLNKQMGFTGEFRDWCMTHYPFSGSMGLICLPIHEWLIFMGSMNVGKYITFHESYWLVNDGILIFHGL